MIFLNNRDDGGKAVFKYQIHISADLPKNRQRIAEMANQLMEKQMQYKQAGEEVDLITPEGMVAFTRIFLFVNKCLSVWDYKDNKMLLKILHMFYLNMLNLLVKVWTPEQAMLAVANSLK